MLDYLEAVWFDAPVTPRRDDLRGAAKLNWQRFSGNGPVH